MSFNRAFVGIVLVIIGCRSHPVEDPNRICSLEEETTQIGNQIWMRHNLNVDTFRNGDSIFRAYSDLDWEYASQNKIPAWGYPENDERLGEIYGNLYNWYAVDNHRKLAPVGWYIPRKADFEGLEEYIEGRMGWKNSAATALRSEKGWEPYGNGTDWYCFTAIPYNGTAWWWTSDEFTFNDNAWTFAIVTYYNDPWINNYDKGNKYSVRCIMR